MNKDFYPFNHNNIVLEDKNKAILKTPQGHLCGYVCLHRSQIPRQWHGNYDADGLQYLSIHGGITYCSIADYPSGINRVTKAVYKPIKKGYSLYNEHIKRKYGKEYFKHYKHSWQVPDKITKALAYYLYKYVVFGFDCAHAGDEENDLLRIPAHVMELTKQMERQLLDYARVIKKWRSVNKDTRIEMMENITNSATIKTGVGLGGMVDILSGGKAFE